MSSSRRAAFVSLGLHLSAFGVGVMVCAHAAERRPPLRIEIEQQPDAIDFVDDAPIEDPVEIEKPVPVERVFDVTVPPKPFEEPPLKDPVILPDMPPLTPPLSLEPIRVTPPPEAVEVQPPKPEPVRQEPQSRTLTAIPGQNPQPDYPARARRRGLQGEVVILVDVDADGIVTEATILTSSGHAILDNAALAAARLWRFSAGPGRAEIPFEFRLR